VGRPTGTVIGSPTSIRTRVGRGNGTNYRQLAIVAGRVLYADETVTQQDASQAWTTLERSLHDLRTNVPPWRRAVATLDPRTLIPAGLVGRALKVLRRYTPTGRPSSI